MTSSRRTVLITVSILLLTLSSVPGAHSYSSSQVMQEIGNAYASTLAAEQNGGNVTALVSQLNAAIMLLQQANSVNGTNPSRAQQLYSQAFSIASSVIQESPSVSAEGERARALSLQVFVVQTAALGGLALLAYFLTPRLFWALWLRSRRGWRVKRA